MMQKLTGLLAQADPEKVEDAFRMFRWALTATGVGVMLIGLMMFFYKPKDESKQSPRSARVTALICFGVIGAATIVYAWTWFGK